MSRSAIAILTFILAAAFALSPAFISDFGGFDADQFPVPQNDPPVQPAGYAFAIWGVIYLWLLVGMGYGLWKRREDAQWHAMRLALAPSLAVGAVWLPVAVVSPVWASVLIWIMLGTALWALLATTQQDRWLLRAPIGLYAGWLTAASWVSLALTGAGYDLLPLSQTAWAIAIIVGALVTAIAVLVSRAPNLAYSAAVIWALVAVVVQNGLSQVSVAGLAALGAVALAGLAIWSERRA